MKIYELGGQRFGRITVLHRADDSRKWACICDCGREFDVFTSHLISGRSKSCGCLRREVSAQRATRHGFCREPLHYVWKTMRQRCGNPRNKDYKYYGARGVHVCTEWDDDYLKFRGWALANGYVAGLTIDRIDTYGDYAPGNCRWITIQEQQKNRRPPMKRKDTA